MTGGLNPKQPEVASVTHANADGERYAGVIREIADAASLPFRIHRPEYVKDWNNCSRPRNPDYIHFLPLFESFSRCVLLEGSGSHG